MTRTVAGNTILRIGIVVLAVGALASMITLTAHLTIGVGEAIVVDVLLMLYWFNVILPSRTNCRAQTFLSKLLYLPLVTHSSTWGRCRVSVPPAMAL